MAALAFSLSAEKEKYFLRFKKAYQQQVIEACFH